jgi:hypothetical protein
MRLDEAKRWIDQIADYRGGFIRVLSLTGGEPFVDVDGLRVLADHARGKGLIVSAVTNAYWASTRERAVAMLRDLESLNMLAISCDVYHQSTIPFARVRHAVLAAKELDRPFNIAVCAESEDDAQHQALLAQLREIVDDDLINTAIVFPVGRALEQLPNLRHDYCADPPRAACSAGSSPMVFPDGNVIACIGPVIDLRAPHPLQLGNLRQNSLASILDEAELNPILHAIRVWGPRKLIALAREAGFEKLLPERYVKDSVCCACYSLMAQPEIVDCLNRVCADDDFIRTVAYARVHYLRETQMARQMGLGRAVA